MSSVSTSAQTLGGTNCPICGREMETYPESPLPEWLDISESVKGMPLIGKYVKNEVEDLKENLRGEIEVKRCTNCGLILTFEEMDGRDAPSKEKLTPLMEKFEEETGKHAKWGGELTKAYKKWRRSRRK